MTTHRLHAGAVVALALVCIFSWNSAGIAQTRGWIKSGNDFVKTGQGEADGIVRYRIAIPPGLTGAFHYNVRLVSENFQVTSFAQSNPFLLV